MKRPQKNEHTLTAAQVAKILKVKPRQVTRKSVTEPTPYCLVGKLETIAPQLGHPVWKYRPADVAAFMLTRRQSGQPKKTSGKTARRNLGKNLSRKNT